MTNFADVIETLSDKQVEELRERADLSLDFLIEVVDNAETNSLEE